LSAEQPTSTPPPGASSLWGSHGGGSRPEPAPAPGGGSGGGQLTPLSQRLLRGAGALAVLLVLVLVNAFLHEEEGGLELNPVAAAAQRVEKIDGGRMSLYIVYSSPQIPQPIAASGGGVFNEKTDRSRISLQFRNPITGERMHLVEIDDGDDKYEGGNVVEGVLPPGKQWVRTSKSEESEEDETPLNMEDSMDLLDDSGRVKLVGRESINGKATCHYRGEVQLEDLVALLRERGKDTEADAYESIEGVSPVQITAEAWVDSKKKLLRRMRVVMPMPGDEGQPPMTVDMRMEFFAYGAQPNIRVPDPSTVVDGPLDAPPASATAS
jgi:hypothetical protein